METICKSRDAEKIQKYIDSFHNTEMGSMYGSFGSKLLGVTADGLNKLADIIRNFNPKSFVKDAKSGLETLQSSLQKQVGELSQKVSETVALSNEIPTTISNEIPTTISNEIPTKISNEIPTTINTNLENEQFVEFPTQNGGRTPFHKLYHPEIKKWVIVKSPEGIDALLKYTYYYG
jgi:hypothetical protein